MMNTSLRLPFGILEHIGGPHAVIGPGAQPCLVRKISNVANLVGTDPAKVMFAKPADYLTTGNVGNKGGTNGYARYSNVSSDGEYILVIATNGAESAIYDRDGAFIKLVKRRLPDGRTAGIGETHDPRWDRSGRAGWEHVLWFTAGSSLFWINLDTMSEAKACTFPDPVWAQNHADQSGRYRCVRTLRTLPDKTRQTAFYLVDLYALQAIKLPWAAPADFDISPSGEYLLIDQGVYDAAPMEFYSIADLAAWAKAPTGLTPDPMSTLDSNSIGHNGWSHDWFVYFDNDTDWIKFHHPGSGKIIKVLNMSEMGWGIGMHMARVEAPELAGWSLVSTYGGKGLPWASRQLFMLHMDGTILRVCHTNTGPTSGYATKDETYFEEAWASIDPAGNHIYWGCNQMGTKCLDLARAELWPGWHQVLAPGHEQFLESLAREWK